jgi:hypothetical protein
MEGASSRSISLNLSKGCKLSKVLQSPSNFNKTLRVDDSLFNVGYHERLNVNRV